jgi:tRNA 2-thiouridine synthesizing protein E
MATMTKGAAPMEFDEDGFLNDPATWNKELAQQIAGNDGVGNLGALHWEVIGQLRDHYLNHGSLVPTRHVCRVSNLEPQCVSDLFRNMQEAWRIAGLPNPGEEAKSYM